MTASDTKPTHLEPVREPQPQVLLRVTGFLTEFERRVALAQAGQEAPTDAMTDPTAAKT